MSENSKIEWTDHTFNPWSGCTKVSPGCEHCYAQHMMDTRLHRVQWGAGKPRARTSAANWREPIKWNARHEVFVAEHGRRQRVFCASLADVFDNEVDPTWRVDLFRLIEATPKLDWLLLTKRIGNARSMSQVAMGAIGCMHKPLPDNVWLGATVVNQEEANRDIPKLLAVPARVRFLSMEPLLGPVTLNQWLLSEHGRRQIGAHRGIGWVIVGGESGHGARPMHPDWARSLRDQCAAAGVAFLFKQWGEWLPVEPNGSALLGCGNTPAREPAFRFAHGHHFAKVGKSAAGRQLDARTHDEFPRTA